MRSDHLSKHIKTHQKGTRLPLAPTSSTDCNLDDIILIAEADQSDLTTVAQANQLAIGLDDDFDSDDESGTDISDSEIASSGVVVAPQK